MWRWGWYQMQSSLSAGDRSLLMSTDCNEEPHSKCLIAVLSAGGEGTKPQNVYWCLYDNGWQWWRWFDDRKSVCFSKMFCKPPLTGSGSNSFVRRPLSILSDVLQEFPTRMALFWLDRQGLITGTRNLRCQELLMDDWWLGTMSTRRYLRKVRGRKVAGSS